MKRRPKVTIGLPVRNGERFIAEALESIRRQTFEDWELVISDNASTDGTSEICRSISDRDARVRYTRTDENLGAAPNFNRTWSLASGEYFRWAAHDDLIDERYLERCVDVLDRDRSVVLCHSKVRVVDSRSAPLYDYAQALRTGSPRPSERFSDLLLVRNNCYEVFGLIRADVLARTRLIGPYPVGDRVLLVELALRGRFHEIPQRLFLSREHDGRSVRRLPTQWQRAAWFHPGWEGRISFPEWRTFAEYARALGGVELDPNERALCGLAMVRWLRKHRKRMRTDVKVAADTVLQRVTT